MARILVTGASSFTGEWIVRALAAEHEVFCAITQASADAYSGERRARLDRIAAVATLVPDIRHDDSLAQAIDEVRPGVLVAHAHPMDGFRNAEYDAAGAWAAMTAHLIGQMEASAAAGTRWLYSGSMYEPTPERPAVSPYGISKRAVWESLRLAGLQAGVEVARITVPNPFGPGEEGRLGTYLAATWLKGETPAIRTPDYVRDNLPVTELAACYARAVDAWPAAPVEPSGYIESNRDFVSRVAREVGARWGRELPVDFAQGAPHPEPMNVANDGDNLSGWADREAAFWDDYAAFLSTVPTGT